jgi:hypothetical protein
MNSWRFMTLGSILLSCLLVACELTELPPPATQTKVPPTPTITNTPIPTGTPIPTDTPELSIVTPTPSQPLKDDFNDGVLDTTKWEGFDCKQGKAEEHSGKVYFHLPVNESSPWETCTLRPEKVKGPAVRKVSLRVTLTDGDNRSSWIGILGHCGGESLNFMASPEWVGFCGEDLQPDCTEMEYFSTLPVERTLTAEWMENELRLTVVDSNKQESVQKSIPCDLPPAFIDFGAATNLGGHVDGAIDDVEVWTISPYLYDDFDSAFEGGYNSDLWSPWTGSPDQVKQQNGVLALTKSGAPGETSVSTRKREFSPSEQWNIIEAKLKLSSQARAGNVGIKIWAYLPSGDWGAQCIIEGGEGDPAYVACGTESYYKSRPTSLDKWRTVRIEIEPRTVKLVFYIDGEKVGSYVPSIAKELRDAIITPTIGVYTATGSPVEGYVDDVRISPIE